MAVQSQRTKRERKKYRAPALEKGLDILELLSMEPAGLSLGGIASRLQRTVGEIFRMVVVLEDRGYLAPVRGTDRFSMSGKLLTISHGYPPVQRVTQVAGPVMRKLARLTGQSCHLVVYHEGRGIIVAQNDSPNDRGLNVKLGAEAPMTDSCSGHVLLAFADDETRQHMLAEQPGRLKKRVSKKALNVSLNKILSRGFERMDSAQVQGVRDIGFPVFDAIGRVSSVLVVPFLSHIDGSNQMDITSVTELLGSAATELSAELGYRARVEQ